MCTALVCKGHSLGGSIIASLYESKKLTVAFVHAGRATCWALPRYLLFDYNSHIFGNFVLLFTPMETEKDTLQFNYSTAG